MNASTLIRFACEPWLLCPPAIQLLVERAQASLFTSESDADKDIVQPIRPGGVAILRINGVLLHGVSEDEAQWLGGTTYESIRDAVAMCSAAPDIKGVLLHINSPGGMATGCPETADVIADLTARKPVVAYADGQMDSGAYWLGAAADTVVASRSASVGSIGCYLAMMDMSQMARNMGIDVKVFRSGELKGIGVPGAPIGDKHAEFLQDHVDRIGAAFRADIAAHRPQLAAEMMDGRDVMGADSVALGFADIVGTFSDAMGELNAWIKARQ